MTDHKTLLAQHDDKPVELPPRPPLIEPPAHPALKRYGITWEGSPGEPLLTRRADGYWTPWHVAADLLRANWPAPPAAPDFRALCAELVEKLDELNCHYSVPNQSAIIERALDALGHSKLVEPTELMTDIAAVPPAERKLAGILHVSNYRGYENSQFDYIADFPDGRYELFTGSTPPAESEVSDLAGMIESWAARLDEGTPEERLLGRVAAVLRQRQVPPHEGEVDALIKILSRIAGMLDFMPDGPLDGPVIHRVIELLRQLAAPPAAGEVAELVEWLNETGNLAGPASIEEASRYWRTAELLQQCHPTPVAVSERPPGPDDCNAKGQCWQEEPGSATEPPGWYLAHYQTIVAYGRGRWLPIHALPLPAGEGK